MDGNPLRHALKSSVNPSQETEGYYDSKGGVNLEWDVQQACMSVLGR